MSNTLSKYEILIKTYTGLYKNISIFAKSPSHARTIVESSEIIRQNEYVCSVFPVSFLY